jgi:DNA-binding response OmpR family regulator
MRVAILEDDPVQSEVLASVVQSLGFHHQQFSALAPLRRALAYETFDLLILDWMLPDGNGPDLIQWFRNAHGGEIPILLVTGKSKEQDVVDGLNAGADDYIVKPIRMAELVARVHALVRRRGRRNPSPVLTLGPYRFDTMARKATFQGVNIELTPREFDLTLVLFKNVGRLLSRSYLLETAWRVKGNLDSRSLDTHISRIRLKLLLREPSPYRLVSVYASGYRIEAAGEEDTISTDSGLTVPS